jgi:hypothetical protein
LITDTYAGWYIMAGWSASPCLVSSRFKRRQSKARQSKAMSLELELELELKREREEIWVVVE